MVHLYFQMVYDWSVLQSPFLVNKYHFNALHNDKTYNVVTYLCCYSLILYVVTLSKVYIVHINLQMVKKCHKGLFLSTRNPNCTKKPIITYFWQTTPSSKYNYPLSLEWAGPASIAAVGADFPTSRNTLQALCWIALIKLNSLVPYTAAP